MRLKYMFEEMKKDPATKLKLAETTQLSPITGSFTKAKQSNSTSMMCLAPKEKKKKPSRNGLLPNQSMRLFLKILKQLTMPGDLMPCTASIFIEGILGSPLLAFASSLQSVEMAMTTPGTSSADIKKAVDAAAAARNNFLAAHNRVSDQNIVAAAVQMFYQDIPKEQHPQGLFEAIRNEYGALDKTATYQKYAEAIFRETMILDNNKWNEFLRNPNATTLQQDLAFNVGKCFCEKLYRQV
jgi:hypothetical protein